LLATGECVPLVVLNVFLNELLSEEDEDDDDEESLPK
jgi:hypothetical protein